MATLEGDYIASSGLEDTIDQPKLKRSASGIERSLNVTRRAAELGINPLDYMFAIMTNNKRFLDIDEDVDIHNRRTVASELASYMVPKLKPVDPELAEEDLPKPIPVFVPRRGSEISLIEKDK